MELENDRVPKLLFPDGLPDNLQDNPELGSYLAQLGTCKVDILKRETVRLADETKCKNEQTVLLAISNYKTFIQTAEKSRSITNEFKKAETQIDGLLARLPAFTDKAQEFRQSAALLNGQRCLNSATLLKSTQLLEILELPQLMSRCIRESRYEEALELATYAQKISHQQGHIPIVKDVVSSVEALWYMMLTKLLGQLRTDLQLPKCLQIVGYLRRMQAFGDSELQLKFLQARSVWLSATLAAISKGDAQQHIAKTIEVTRINVFNIFTQYRAIFPEDEKATSSVMPQRPLGAIVSGGSRLLYTWLQTQIENFLSTLEEDLTQKVNSLDTLLGQCMYFGLSFSRIGADFRALIAPIFVRVIRKKFQDAIAKTIVLFESELMKYTLNRKIVTHTHRAQYLSGISPGIDQYGLSPPETLLDFLPLASLCNGFLEALNELRLCAPIALATDVTRCLQHALEHAASKISAFHRQEKQAFSGKEQTVFLQMCSCFAGDFIPYVQHCIHTVFPTHRMSEHIGIGLVALEEQQITYLRRENIFEPIKNLLSVQLSISSALHEQGESTVNIVA